MKLPKKVIICEDVTRDGFQSAPVDVSAEDKVQIIDMAADAGVSCFEVGAFTPNSESMKKMWNTKDVFRLLKQREGVSYRALIFDEDGVKEAYEAGCPKVKINISASDAHHKGGAGMTTREAMKQFSKIGNFASDHGIAMCGSISLPFISPFEGEGVIPMDRLEDIIRGFMDIGIREISLSDAAGLGDPAGIFRQLGAKKGVTILEIVHCRLPALFVRDEDGKTLCPRKPGHPFQGEMGPVFPQAPVPGPQPLAVMQPGDGITVQVK